MIWAHFVPHIIPHNVPLELMGPYHPKYSFPYHLSYRPVATKIVKLCKVLSSKSTMPAGDFPLGIGALTNKKENV